MKVRVLAKSSNIYSGGMPASLVGDYLESGLTDYGGAVIEIDVLIAFRSGPKWASEVHPEFHYKYLPSLPITRFIRKKARMDIQYESKASGATFLGRRRFPSAGFFSKVLHEMAENLHLIDNRLKKSDDFDLTRFHADVARLVANAPRSDRGLKLLYNKFGNEQITRFAAMGPWERLGVEWEEYHPSARSLLNDPFFWSEADSNSPHANDSGADLLNAFKEWNKKHPNRPAHQMARRLLKDWEAGGMDLRLVKAAAVASIFEEDSFVLQTADEVMIAIAFAAVKLRGCCDRETRELALLAIARERIPEIVGEWQDSESRKSRLTLLARTLKKTPEAPPTA
jgi:uncharacterized protein YfeS